MNFTFFYINGRKYWFRENFIFPVFDGVLGCPEQDLTMPGKCPCVCVCESDKNFVVNVAR